MGKAEPVNVQAARVIPAPPELLYGLVSDVTRMGCWSPETVRATWVGGATEAAVGAQFKGWNRLGRVRWSTTPTVIAAESGRRFAFTVPGRFGTTWTYEFEPVSNGTRVTESAQQAKPSPAPIRVLQRLGGVTDRSASLTSGITSTLERLADYVCTQPLSTSNHN